MLISIVIPVHNEAGNIGPLINEIVQLSLKDLYQIVVVNDASDDDTPRILSESKKNIPALRVISLKEQRGQSAAIATGVEQSEGDLIVTMDGDGQNDPADIPRLVSALLEDQTRRMVVGFRRNRKDSLWKITSSKIANSVRSFLLKDNTPDAGCGLKAFYKSTFTALPFFDHMHRFLPALIQMQGGRVISIEVNHRPRKRGRSNYGTLDRLWAGIIDVFRVYRMRTQSEKVAHKVAHKESLTT
ncbi:MAG: glycosyltransferase family 2 protein [Candidatus Omnitrophica bacterium]|nr:glycosyltransferase family 2 protein [Candidatus Omnitrophota bacterium]